jgi:L-lactate dehydrogenase complex protein LldG
MSAREEILGRVRQALRSWPSADGRVPRDYLRRHADADLVGLFAERVADYRATVSRVPADAIPAAVAAALTTRGLAEVVAAPGLPAAWLPPAAGVTWLADEPPLTVAALDACDGAVTTAALGIALTGTIVLDAGVGQGRRVLTLVPDVHICVLMADQIVADVPDAVAALDPARPLTFISGPSATSDIELNRIEGVHGPRTLHVIIGEGASA